MQLSGPGDGEVGKGLSMLHTTKNRWVKAVEGVRVEVGEYEDGEQVGWMNIDEPAVQSNPSKQ